MSAPFVLAVPSKGRLQENAEAFFNRAGLTLAKSGGVRDYRGTISAKTQLMNVDYSAFEGWEIEGRPSVVTVRGEIAARDGQFTGTVGRGNFLKREPQYF